MSTAFVSPPSASEKTKREARCAWIEAEIERIDALARQGHSAGSHNQGNAPDWRLGSIQVRSARYNVAMQAMFDQWIDSTAPFSRPLVNL